MGNPTNTIELNGKQYDARSGKLVSNSSKPSSSTKTSQVVDGFVRRPRSIEQNNLTPKPKISRTNVNHAKRKPAKSQALMRPAVKKPDQIKNDIQKVKHVQNPNHANDLRFSRAQSAAKSPLISRFGRNAPVSNVKKSVEHLPVVSAPLAINAAKKAVSGELERFEQALKNASSHMHQLENGVIKKVPFLKRVGFKNRVANLATMCAGFLLLVGFFAYQNSASISMRVAAQRAGINAKMPGYVPAGFSAGRTATATDGQVSLAFISNTDDKSFSLSQQASEWNSSSLLANHVQKRNCATCYQTWQDSGKTVYIYDNSNATWVDGGIWYQVEGNATLTSDQLLRLANSL